MNAKKLIVAAVVAVAASGSAFAQDHSEFFDFTSIVSTKTRAEVKAELAEAYANGELVRSEFVEFPQTASTVTRAQVRAELAEANSDRQILRAPEWVEFPAVASTKTREEVRKEAVQAAKVGRNNFGS